MGHNNKIITDKEAAARNMGLTKNFDSACPRVGIEKGFELYRALYENTANHESWNFVFGSRSDEQAIETAFKNEPENKTCIFVNRLVLREDGEPSSTIICGS